MQDHAFNAATARNAFFQGAPQGTLSVMRVLLALDRSANAGAAARFIDHLPLPKGSTLYLVHVIEPPVPLSPSRIEYPIDLTGNIARVRAELAQGAQAFLKRMKATFHKRDVTIECAALEGIPGRELLQFITTRDVGLVVVGNRGLSRVQRFFLGSLSEWLLSEAPCPVLIVRQAPQWIKRKTKTMRLLLATDGSADAQQAADFVRTLPLADKAQITLVHVVVEAPVFKGKGSFVAASRFDLKRVRDEITNVQGSYGAKVLGEEGAKFRNLGWSVAERLLKGHIADTIIDACHSEHPDLVVLGSQGLTGLRRFLLGSVSHKVARHATSSVLVVRSKGEPSRSAVEATT